MPDRRSLVVFNNVTSYPLTLTGKNEIEGYWSQIPTRIAPGESVDHPKLTMNDKFGFYGSKGSVKYLIGNGPQHVSVHVACPFSDDNKAFWMFSHMDGHPDIIFEDPTFNKTGSPLEAYFTMRPKGSYDKRRLRGSNESEAQIHLRTSNGDDAQGITEDENLPEPEEIVDFSLKELEVVEAEYDPAASSKTNTRGNEISESVAGSEPVNVRVAILRNRSQNEDLVPVVQFSKLQPLTLTERTLSPESAYKFDLWSVAQRANLPNETGFRLGVYSTSSGYQWLTSSWRLVITSEANSDRQPLTSTIFQ